MEWLLRHGPHLEYLEEIAEAHPDEVPAPLLEQPHLAQHTAAVFEAFLELSECRSSNGYGPNPITAADITAYLWINPICDSRRFFGLVKSLDKVFLDWHAKKAAEAKK